ncbi:MAG: c-type cytochrome, partial [Rhodospirillaceae bacterium]|nr:c-type cytochrome [Rhodospirillaceae bacterium]
MEINKIFAAILVAGLIGMSAGFVAELLISPHHPEENAYHVDTGDGGAAPVAQQEEALPPIAGLLATADPAAGETLARACTTCHVLDSSGENRVGPGLWGVVGRPTASHEGFSYSAGMQAHAEEAPDWTYEQLNHFLRRPRDWVPGTSMSYAGIRNDQDRANVIAYLRTLSEDPLPLPDPNEGVEESAEGAAVEEDAAAEEPTGEAVTEESGDEAPADEATEEAPTEETTGEAVTEEPAATEVVEDAAETAAETVSETVDQAAEAAGEVADEAAETADQAAEAAGNAVDA